MYTGNNNNNNNNNNNTDDDVDNNNNNNNNNNINNNNHVSTTLFILDLGNNFLIYNNGHSCQETQYNLFFCFFIPPHTHTFSVTQLYNRADQQTRHIIDTFSFIKVNYTFYLSPLLSVVR